MNFLSPIKSLVPVYISPATSIKSFLLFFYWTPSSLNTVSSICFHQSAGFYLPRTGSNRRLRPFIPSTNSFLYKVSFGLSLACDGGCHMVFHWLLLDSFGENCVCVFFVYTAIFSIFSNFWSPFIHTEDVNLCLLDRHKYMFCLKRKGKMIS